MLNLCSDNYIVQYSILENIGYGKFFGINNGNNI